MGYTVKATNEYTREFSFRIELPKDLPQRVNAHLLAKRRDAHLKGFRKGKAPLGLITEIYGPKIEEKLILEFIYEKWKETVTKEKITVVRTPAVDLIDHELGKFISFKAVAEILPHVVPKDYSGVSFEEVVPIVEEAEIEAIKKVIMVKDVHLVEIKGSTLEWNCVAIVNTQIIGEKCGTIERNDDIMIPMDDGHHPTPLQKGILGMRPGEKRTIDLTSDDDNSDNDSTGRNLTMVVELLEIKKAIYPPFDDAMAQKAGFQSLDDFTTKMKDSLLEKKLEEERTACRYRILKKIFENNPFEVPEGAVSSYAEETKENMRKDLKKENRSDESIEKEIDEMEDTIYAGARFSIKRQALMESLKKEMAIDVGVGMDDPTYGEKIEDKVFLALKEKLASQNHSLRKTFFRKPFFFRRTRLWGRATPRDIQHTTKHELAQDAKGSAS